MARIIKNTLLNYIPQTIDIEKNINPARIFEINSNKIQGKNVIYLCERAIRTKDNFALQFALQKSKELNLPLKIIHPKINYINENKENFINSQISQTQKIFTKLNLAFEIIKNKNINQYIENLEPAILITEFNPIIKKEWLKNLSCKIYEIDTHNIIPARYISNKQEYNAQTLRRKIYLNISNFLSEFDNLTTEKVEADYFLENFIKNKLDYYAEFKNNPDKDMTSGLSKYINSGFISTQRITLEVIKAKTSIQNKEAFLEELIIRKELAENFCLNTKNFKDFSGIPNWAKISLTKHQKDLRIYNYTIEELENVKTHDKLWNATQIQLITEGKIHGYLRMYWAKKILEWSISPQDALNKAIYLNDKYAYDAPSANGYAGILWATGALHDRAFKDYPITGKIRRMNYNSMKKKYNLSKYIEKYLSE